jgi:hypothetical protein
LAGLAFQARQNAVSKTDGFSKENTPAFSSIHPVSNEMILIRLLLLAVLTWTIEIKVHQELNPHPKTPQ